MTKQLTLTLLTAGLATSAHAALIANGDLETAITKITDAGGASDYTLDASNNVIVTNPGTGSPGDVGVDAGEWLSNSITRAFTWTATAGNGGTGGFGPQGTVGNGKPRAVAFFANDAKATTGDVTASIDIKLNQAAEFIQVELWGWNGTTSPAISLGGATAGDPDSYNVTTLNGATSLLDFSADTATLDTWTTVDLGTISTGTGYDNYVWRIGIVGDTDGAGYAFDNLEISVVPEPSSAALLGLAGFALILRRRK
ncbi:MAG: PEP-CTERM sorting domain-containing protein [Verrucomicrobiae bacterium]|nr:PEP-CTERM sorting domain-containing protein [Verrucomicrobiae bacterium]NNJ86853.1 PEP-CTERM sorting domain-containing protein [Akkermansiaceae bacterium]